MFVLLFLAAYLVGSIPIGYLIGKIFYGLDITEHGSGTMGATNIGRVLGKRTEGVVFALDALKGLAPLLLLRESGLLSLPLAFGAGLGLPLGHCFSLFLWLKHLRKPPAERKAMSGKGVATSFGFALACNPIAAMIGISVFWLVRRLSNYVSVASIVGTFAALPAAWLLGAPPWQLWYFLALSILVTCTHRQNMGRLWLGTESVRKPLPELKEFDVTRRPPKGTVAIDAAGVPDPDENHFKALKENLASVRKALSCKPRYARTILLVGHPNAIRLAAQDVRLAGSANLLIFPTANTATDQTPSLRTCETLRSSGRVQAAFSRAGDDMLVRGVQDAEHLSSCLTDILSHP